LDSKSLGFIKQAQEPIFTKRKLLNRKKPRLLKPMLLRLPKVQATEKEEAEEEEEVVEVDGDESLIF